MNIKQEVFSKITEMSKEYEARRVELALVDDFTKVYQQALNLQEKAEVNIVNYNELAASIQAVLNQAGTQFLRANSLYSELEEFSRNLGIDLPEQYKNKKDIISKSLKEIDSYNKKLSSNKVSI